MNRTASDHPLVAGYLRQLDGALRLVPVGRAQELREQITAHLGEALPPGAGDQEVTEVLGRLGRPADLAAEAVATGGKRPWPARLGWRAWALIAAAAVVTGAVASYLAVMLSAAPIDAEGSYSWWYAQDGARQVSTSADGRDQSTVPVRPGQQQGFAVQVVNLSGQTQTVLGSNGEYGLGCSTMQVSVSAEDPDSVGHYPTSPALHFTLPGSIPPHQTRILRVLWTSARDCLSPDSQQSIDDLMLKVRIGLVTRTEDMPLPQAWGLAGK
jgi:hypothetical protein